MQKTTQQELVSCDAPPLDFSFKNIKNLQQLSFIQPRQGIRLNPVDEDGKPLIPSKIEQKHQDNLHIQQQLSNVNSLKQQPKKKTQPTKLLPQSNINSFVTNLVNNSAMKNISTKAKQQLEKNKKKTVHIKLICCSLILSYNRLRELSKFQSVISGIMPEHKNLQWIDLSHNCLQKLDYGFEDYPQLRTLYIHCNYLYDLNDFKCLTKRQNLKTLNIHGNPMAEVLNFRCYLISMLPNLKKIDSVLVSKKQKDNANFLKTQVKKFPMPKDPAKPPVQKPQEEQQDKQVL